MICLDRMESWNEGRHRSVSCLTTVVAGRLCEAAQFAKADRTFSSEQGRVCWYLKGRRLIERLDPALVRFRRVSCQSVRCSEQSGRPRQLSEVSYISRPCSRSVDIGILRSCAKKGLHPCISSLNFGFEEKSGKV